MDCKESTSLMHEYLDDELSLSQKSGLESHLSICPDCRMRFKELEQTDMLLYAMRHYSPSASDELTDRIMSAVPEPKKQQPWLKWVKRHPALTAAAIFVIVMFSSTISFWDQSNQLIVSGDDLDQIVIEGNDVIVPEGKSITGNLTVENGTAKVYGNVEGNLTIIDGHYMTASTAHISGQIKSIDQALDWIWYKITDVMNVVAYR
ncbi:zf-HC2 domain-containing protein [Paenibacillus shunpengii]|uniref:Anti-sigma-W factor RsiW n=1 Tax=Paenibacillus shunpengii TaxID=2054424 RepID=A0ABW5STM4_9BACL|nr:zf-HC2 domain-containing protein [Paenibacillus sp. PDC88]SDX68563.1 Transmembrane transcriptional regulator (anti-sigma factor RsiW) [Paenibacillus sp. PDC88]